MHFRRLKGRKSEILKDMFDEPVVIELVDGKKYAGAVDEYYYNGGGVLALYSCKLLDRSAHKWVEHDIFMKRDNEIIRDSLPDFAIRDIRVIEVLSDDLKDRIDLDDALQLYLDPHHKPLPGVNCAWRGGNGHSAGCDSRLHEALSLLLTESEVGVSTSKKGDKSLDTRIDESFAIVRRRLLMSGARIP
jgi:hypothetical protein